MTTPTTDEINLYDEVNNPPEKTYDLFGKVEFQAFKGAYEKGTRGAVPFNPATHQKAHTIVKIYIQPLVEIDIKYPKHLEYESTTWADWGKITWPSIKALGINDAREINDRWARVARVPNGRKYDKRDTAGNLTGEQGDELTFKFIAFFASEDECRAAYVAAGGQPVNGNGANGNGQHVAQPATNGNAEKDTAYAFLKVIVQNAVRGLTDWNEAKAAVAKALVQYPTVSQFFTADSKETTDLMSESNDKLLPF